ncbi:MAG: pilus assembly protein N-terminal domain-containing protein, partial [Desulfosarcina sp.]|nr:pilus assembly protein N-terminal domain-containing protein [Desulfobacterales bacterium]
MSEPLQAAAISDIKGVYLQNTLLFETDRGFNRVTVGDARIAGARAISQRQLLIKGLTPGRTNLLI